MPDQHNLLSSTKSTVGWARMACSFRYLAEGLSFVALPFDVLPVLLLVFVVLCCVSVLSLLLSPSFSLLLLCPSLAEEGPKEGIVVVELDLCFVSPSPVIRLFRTSVLLVCADGVAAESVIDGRLTLYCSGG